MRWHPNAHQLNPSDRPHLLISPFLKVYTLPLGIDANTSWPPAFEEAFWTISEGSVESMEAPLLDDQKLKARMKMSRIASGLADLGILASSPTI